MLLALASFIRLDDAGLFEDALSKIVQALLNLALFGTILLPRRSFFALRAWLDLFTDFANGLGLDLFVLSILGLFGIIRTVLFMTAASFFASHYYDSILTIINYNIFKGSN